MLPLLGLLRRAPPHLALGVFPSPLEQYPALGRALGFQSLLIKREDRNSAELGGNKLRALEWILPGAGPAILSIGGFGSTWCATLAHYASARGHRVGVVLFPQPWTETVERILTVTLAQADVVLARSLWSVPLNLARARWRLRHQARLITWVPAGGASGLGILGSVNAALELVEQVARGDSPRPDVVLVPLGSGGTAAGLLVGFQLAGWEITVAAVGVTPPWITGRATVLRLAHRARRLLRACGARVPRSQVSLRVLRGELGAGYGHPTERGRAARDTLGALGIGSELTYGAKTFAALGGLAGSFQHPCFWHTFDTRLLAAPPSAADHPLVHEARARAELLWPTPKSI